MKFSELEEIMLSRGVGTLAEIARVLKTTPQAVSNWKARDQVPYHVVVYINKKVLNKTSATKSPVDLKRDVNASQIGLSDILIVLAEQLKIIALITFISVFISFTYVQFILKPEYVSNAKILLPENKSQSFSGIAGLASQFGVNLPSSSRADLSSPSLFPELLKSRTFAIKILRKKFYSSALNRKTSLLSILSSSEGDSGEIDDNEIIQYIPLLNETLEFKKIPATNFSELSVTTNDPTLSRQLAQEIIGELELLNRFYKSQSVSEKTKFISERIVTVEDDLISSEKKLKEFNEQNRQISSPSLQLELDRFSREVEIQKGIYLTLKQQLELAKIEEVQEASIVQVLDPPQLPLGPSNKNLKKTILLSLFVGLGLGIIIGFFRSYINNDDMHERRKLRRVRNFVKKKTKEIVLDYRFTGTISILLFLCLPFYLGHRSEIPKFFGVYSSKLMLLIICYILVLIFSTILFFRSKKNIRKSVNQ